MKHIDEELVSLSVANPPTGEIQAAEDVTIRAERLSLDRAELERELSEHSQAYRTARAKSRIDTEQIRTVLPPGTALIDVVEYFHRESAGADRQGPYRKRRLLAFVVRPDRATVAMVPLGSSSELVKLIDHWRASYGAGKLPAEGKIDPGDELRTRLWKPLEEHLRDVHVILVSPDGPLHGLPWAAVPGSTPKSFLIQQYAFAVVPTPQLLPDVLREGNVPRPVEEQPSLLLAGGIDFGSGRAPESKGMTRNCRQFRSTSRFPQQKVRSMTWRSGSDTPFRTRRVQICSTRTGRPSKQLLPPLRRTGSSTGPPMDFLPTNRSSSS